MLFSHHVCSFFSGTGINVWFQWFLKWNQFFCELQKFSSGLGSLPQLETPVVQVVVSNAKNQLQQSDNILPQITNKGGQNNYQTVSPTFTASPADGSSRSAPKHFQLTRRKNRKFSPFAAGREVKVNSAVHDALRRSDGQGGHVA